MHALKIMVNLNCFKKKKLFYSRIQAKGKYREPLNNVISRSSF